MARPSTSRPFESRTNTRARASSSSMPSRFMPSRIASAEVRGLRGGVLPVRSDVESDRKRAVGADASGHGVERQLADRDPHPAVALIADAEYRGGVRRDDDADVVEEAVFCGSRSA